MPEKTITRSFRINENAFLALEEEAKKRNISVNTLVNQLFLCYANFDRHLEKHGFLKMSKVTFRKILEDAPEKETVELAREVARNSSRTLILAKYGELSLSNFLDYLKNLDDYAYFIEYNEVYSPGQKRVITLMHRYGEKGSIFIKAFAQALFELIDMKPKVSSTKNSVTIEI
jgi:hypothetical protein